MRLAEAWRVAVTALRANRLRSLLTMLGVVIGVAAVVVLVAIGTGAQREVEAQVNGLGANLVIVVPGRLEFGRRPPRAGSSCPTPTGSAGPPVRTSR
jgi:putative ABC transport system permease protein